MNVTAPKPNVSRIMRRRGALILPLFALIWTAAGISGIGSPALAWTAGLVVVALVVAVLVLAMRDGCLSDLVRPLEMPPEWNRRLARVNLLQAAGIGVSIVVLIVVGRPEMIPAVVCLIVGLHFFPLSQIFGQPQYTWTGTALCVVSAAGFATVLMIGGPASRVVVGLGAAATLLVTAFQLASAE